MGGNLSVYNLGQLGVNVDKDPLQLEDGELATAQNVIPNPIGDGGLVNRHGLVKLNAVAAADTSTGILGGIGVPLPFSRRVYVAQFSGGGANWLSSTGAFATAATQATTPGEPAKTGKLGSFYNAITSLTSPTYGRVACSYGNTIIYAANNYTQGTTAPPVFYYDGSMDRLLFSVPTNPDAAVVSQTVIWLLVVGGYIYFSTHDTGDQNGGGACTYKGAVYQYNVATNSITRMGATFPTGFLPYTLCWSNDRLWVGTISGAGKSTAGKVYWIRPSIDAAWTLDKTFSNDFYPTTMCSFNGELYVGTYAFTGSSAIVQKRSTAGAWSTVDTAGGTSPSGENWYGGLIQFGTSIYVGYFDNGAPSAPKIRKFDGSSWSTVKTASNSVIYSHSFVDNGVLFFWAANSVNAETFLTTTTGSAWTDRTANIIPGANRASTGAAVLVT